MRQAQSKAQKPGQTPLALPPRVALIASSLKRGGAEKQTVYAARALSEAGIEVRFYHFGVDGHYAAVLRGCGIPLDQFYVPNRPWMILVRLLRALRQWRPQVVLTNQFGDLLHGASAGRFCSALTLGGVRSNGFYELDSQGRRGRWMHHLVHGLIANSSCARENLASRGIDPTKIALLPNVIDLKEFDEERKLPVKVSLPEGRLIALAIGRLHPCKGFDQFLEALALARRRQPLLAGVIAGADGGAQAALQAQAQSLGLKRPDLYLLGESDRIPALLRRSALLVLSSKYEGFPNVLLEAMAAGLPVITTPAGDAGLVVQHRQTGYVVAPGDIDTMANRMVALAQSPSLGSQMGEAGRRRVEQVYNYEGLADRLLGIFRQFSRKHVDFHWRESLNAFLSAGSAQV